LQRNHGFNLWRVSDTPDITFRLQNGDKSINVKGSVPGEVHTDLLAAKVLKEDPYVRFNEVNYRWVAEGTWMYVSTPFALDDYANSSSTTQPLYLRFEGLDTVANVYFNEKLVGSSSNAFTSHTFAIEWSAVRTGKRNELVIVLTSAFQYGKHLINTYSFSCIIRLLLRYF
jgi:beta-galactosidase/beta-glucuronidase